MSQETTRHASTSNECISTVTAPMTVKRRASSSPFIYSRSAKRRRVSMASVDLSQEMEIQGITELRPGTSADRFIPSRPKFSVPLDTTPRSTRIAKTWRLADDRVLNFADASSSMPQPKLHSLLRKSASELFELPQPAHGSTSATANILKRQQLTMALDIQGISSNRFAYPISWSTKNYIAVACDDDVYYQDLNTRLVTRMWSAKANDELHAIEWAGASMPNVLAMGTAGGKVSLCDAETRKLSMVWPGDSTCAVGGLAWSDTTLAVGRRSGDISLFDSRLQDEVKSLTGHKAKVHGLKWTQDGRYLASGDYDGTVHIWDARADKPLVGEGVKGRKMKHKGPVKALSWCPWKPDLLATGSFYPDGAIRIWSALSAATSSSPSPVHTIILNTSITSLHWSPHCKELLSTHGSTWSNSPTPVIPTGSLKPIVSPLGNSVTVHTYPSCKRLVSVPCHLGAISHSCISPDGTKVFTASAWDEALKMWKIWGVREGVGKQESVFDKCAIR